MAQETNIHASAARSCIAGLISLLALGCVGDVEEDPGTASAVEAIAGMRESLGMETEVLSPTGTCTCTTSSALDPDCDYTFIPATGACATGTYDESYDDYIYTYRVQIANYDLDYDLPLYCGLPDIYNYIKGYNNGVLNYVTVYGMSPLSGHEVYAALYSYGMAQESGTSIGNCTVPVGTGTDIQDCDIDTSSMGSMDFLVGAYVLLPDREGGYNATYLQGFVLCYDPD